MIILVDLKFFHSNPVERVTSRQIFTQNKNKYSLYVQYKPMFPTRYGRKIPDKYKSCCTLLGK